MPTAALRSGVVITTTLSERLEVYPPPRSLSWRRRFLFFFFVSRLSGCQSQVGLIVAPGMVLEGRTYASCFWFNSRRSFWTICFFFLVGFWWMNCVFFFIISSSDVFFFCWGAKRSWWMNCDPSWDCFGKLVLHFTIVCLPKISLKTSFQLLLSILLFFLDFWRVFFLFRRRVFLAKHRIAWFGLLREAGPSYLPLDFFTEKPKLFLQLPLPTLLFDQKKGVCYDLKPRPGRERSSALPLPRAQMGPSPLHSQGRKHKTKRKTRNSQLQRPSKVKAKEPPKRDKRT